MAARFAAFLGLVVCGAGLYLVVDSTLVGRIADSFVTPTGLWTAVAFRLTLGVLLWICAAASRAPLVLKVLAVLFVVSGLSLPVIGLERMGDIVDWAAILDPLLLRGIGLVAGSLGAFIVWSVWPRRSEA